MKTIVRTDENDIIYEGKNFPLPYPDVVVLFSTNRYRVKNSIIDLNRKEIIIEVRKTF